MKSCSKCRTEKPLEDFGNWRYGKDGKRPECKNCRKEEGRRWRAANPDYQKAHYSANGDMHSGHALKRRYGLTIDDYNQRLAEQGGLCANPGCSNTPADNGRRFDVDHDHACCPTGGSCGECIRGLLCSGCNRALGLLHEDTERLQGLIHYLDSRSAQLAAS